MRLDHINICASIDLLEEVRDFYCSILGLSVGPRPGLSRGGFWLYHESQAIIHLSERDDRSVFPNKGHLDHIAFRSSGLPAFLEKLDAHNIQYRHIQSDTNRPCQIFFSDPCGVGLEVSFADDA